MSSRLNRCPRCQSATPHQATGVGPTATAEQSNTGAAEELAALKATLAQQAAAHRAKYTGWKPVTIWYALWTLLIGFGSVSALLSGSFGTFIIGSVITGLGGLYAKYLYNGGTRRVWFFIF